jgi:demethoxyubiquinone hydroxylase (CLK1/Coq7/Cat5 family)
VIDRIVRVDQAGELGANWIYRGQKMAMGLRGDRKAVKQIDVGRSLSSAIDICHIVPDDIV